MTSMTPSNHEMLNLIFSPFEMIRFFTPFRMTIISNFPIATRSLRGEGGIRALELIGFLFAYCLMPMPFALSLTLMAHPDLMETAPSGQTSKQQKHRIHRR